MLKTKPVCLILALLLIGPLLLCGAVKMKYGGGLRVRFFEPDSLNMSPSNYSNLLLYSLIYENFFYNFPDKGLKSNLFKRYYYDETSRTLTLDLYEGLAFSNGKPILARHVKTSLTSFLNRVLYRSRKIAGFVKTMIVKGDYSIEITLTSNQPNIFYDLSAPELIMTGDEEAAFSGPFLPGNWEKGVKLNLIVNPYYAGGRHPLDSVTALFRDDGLADIFLAETGLTLESHKSIPSGLYQNVYITFPELDKAGQNNRIALYSLCHTLTGLNGFLPLNVLTSPQESPLSLSIDTFSDRRIISLLRNSKQIIYLSSSLQTLETSLNQRFQSLQIPLEIRVISDNELNGYVQNNPVPVLIQGKLFRSDTPIPEKIAMLVREFRYGKFDEELLGLINQLEELIKLKNEDLQMATLGKVMEKVIAGGVILPLYQQRFSLMIRNDLNPVLIDGYGRISWSELRYEKKDPPQS